MIGRKAILAFGVNGAKNAIGYIGLFFIARFMGPESLGVLSFGFAFIGIFNFVADLGFAVAHIKKVSEGAPQGKCVATFLAIRSVLTALMVVAVLGTVAVYKYGLGFAFESPEHEQVVYLALATMVVLNISTVPQMTFAARKETARQSIPELVGKSLEMAIKVAVAVLGLSVVLLAGGALVGGTVSLLLYVILFRGHPLGRPDWKLAKEYIWFALPVTIVVSSNAVTQNLDQIMIQGFWDARELGFYAGAGKITMVFGFAGTAVGSLLFPTISSFHGSSDTALIRRVCRRAERFLGLLFVPVGAALTVFSGPVVALILGAEFAPSGAVLSVLAWAAIVRVVSVPYSTQIIGTNRARLSALLSVILMALNVSLNLLLVPETLFGIRMAGLGAVGAAVATLVATTIMAVLYRVLASRLTGTQWNWGVVRQFGAATGMVVVMCGVLMVGGSLGAWRYALSLSAGGGVYLGFLYIMHELTGDDLKYILCAVSPFLMKRYVIDEMRGRSDAGPEDDRDV